MWNAFHEWIQIFQEKYSPTKRFLKATACHGNQSRMWHEYLCAKKLNPFGKRDTNWSLARAPRKILLLTPSLKLREVNLGQWPLLRTISTKIGGRWFGTRSPGLSESVDPPRESWLGSRGRQSPYTQPPIPRTGVARGGGGRWDHSNLWDNAGQKKH